MHESNIIEFERLAEQHFPLLEKWLNTSHVKKWWDQDVQWNAELVNEKYKSYVQEYKLEHGQRKGIQGYIINVDSKPVGYIQIYNLHDYHDNPELKGISDPLPSIDMYIGETSYLKQGIGTGALNAFVSQYAKKMANTIFIAADNDNIAALKTYQACGFKEFKHMKNEIWMLNTEADVMRIHCQEPWFSKIRAGLKTVEGRKFNAKYANLKPGDLLEFYCGSDSFLTEVVAVTIYKSLEEYLEKEGLQNVLPGVHSFEDAVQVYLQYSTREELDAGGFLGIHVRIR